MFSAWVCEMFVIADWCRGCSTSNDEWCVATSTYHTCMFDVLFDVGGKS